MCSQVSTACKDGIVANLHGHILGRGSVTVGSGKAVVDAVSGFLILATPVAVPGAPGVLLRGSFSGNNSGCEVGGPAEALRVLALRHLGGGISALSPSFALRVSHVTSWFLASARCSVLHHALVIVLRGRIEVPSQAGVVTVHRLLSTLCGRRHAVPAVLAWGVSGGGCSVRKIRSCCWDNVRSYMRRCKHVHCHLRC